MGTNTFKPLRGILAGFVATLVLSALMVMKVKTGLMPDLNVIAMLGHMMGSDMVAGWAAHFMIGSLVWGLSFAFFFDKLPGGSAWLKGIVFGMAAWLMMMLAVMPMAGAGIFGSHFGMMAPIMTLMLHAVFGAVMGAVYAQSRS